MTNKYNFGVIGNCSYLAYIDTRANVNWLCLPRIDSSFINVYKTEDVFSHIIVSGLPAYVVFNYEN